uniref:Putative homing endonuclease n=1 Tax=viral metagenome TaxID=1070528 RepID=A0A6M3K3I3_9ZZZZ
MANYSNKLRNDLLKETNYKCSYCGNDLNNIYEIEHFIPKSQGGTGKRKNLTVSCRKCNIAKLDYSLEKFKQRIKVKTFYYEKIGLSKGEIYGKPFYR